jgi:hypothetical protein
VTTQSRRPEWIKAASWPIPSRSAPPSDEGMRRRMRSINSSSKIRNGGFDIRRSIVLAPNESAKNRIVIDIPANLIVMISGRYVGTVWSVLPYSWTRSQLSHRVIGNAHLVKIWLTPQTVFFRLTAAFGPRLAVQGFSHSRPGTAALAVCSGLKKFRIRSAFL